MCSRSTSRSLSEWGSCDGEEQRNIPNALRVWSLNPSGKEKGRKKAAAEVLIFVFSQKSTEPGSAWPSNEKRIKFYKRAVPQIFSGTALFCVEYSPRSAVFALRRGWSVYRKITAPDGKLPRGVFDKIIAPRGERPVLPVLTGKSTNIILYLKTKSNTKNIAYKSKHLIEFQQRRTRNGAYDDL